MKRLQKAFLFSGLLFLFFSCSTKKSAQDLSEGHRLSGYQQVHLGWLDLREENWALYGYYDQETFAKFIKRLNSYFQADCRTRHLKSKNLSFTSSATDEKFPSTGLLISFEEINPDYDSYLLSLTIKLTDLNTGETKLVFKNRSFYGDNWGFEGYLIEATKDIGAMLGVVIE